MDTALIILKRYWKHQQFRPFQEEIIHHVVSGNDTLALLPTGGGKSVCFQVPAILLKDLCIVISPLIALMKDQVENLKKKGLMAVAIHSGMSREEIDLHLNNCVHGKFNFLYVSPERLHTEIFQARVKQMPVSLIAVDEAHCISQWGYDFRPSYLQISKLREFFPQVPIIALTATATPAVKDDIVSKLLFTPSHKVFQQSFVRENISFVIRKAENKERKLLEILQKVKGSAIIYVRSRKSTQEVADLLNRKSIAATYYHAGLHFELRTAHQDDWIKGRKRVIVATNAFGMGIDKPDVRVVVHLDLPENLESYYQEAGRAGRDGHQSYAAILYHTADISSLESKVQQAHPSVEYLKTVYQALANYFQLAVGSSQGESYEFELHEFCDRFSFHMNEVYAALKKLEEEGLIQFNESFYSPSQLIFSADKAKLYEFQVANERFDPIIKMLLRLYGGQLSNDFTKISEVYLAKALNVPLEEVISMLRHLHELRLLIYHPVKDKPMITFILPRQDAEKLPVNRVRLRERKELAVDKMKAMIEFVTSTHRCRMELIQDYFGEEVFQPCGKCDVCVAAKKKDSSNEAKELHQEIMHVVKEQMVTVEQLEEIISPRDAELFVEVVREMVDEGILEYDEVWRLKIKQQL